MKSTTDMITVSPNPFEVLFDRIAPPCKTVGRPHRGHKVPLLREVNGGPALACLPVREVGRQYSTEGSAGTAAWVDVTRRKVATIKKRRTSARERRLYKKLREGYSAPEAMAEWKRADIPKESMPVCPIPENIGDSQVALDGFSESINKEKTCSDPDCFYGGKRCCDPDRMCLKSQDLKRKARQVLRHLKKTLRLTPVRGLPHDLSCLTFRQGVRQCFDDIDCVSELSVKTTSKVVRRACDNCEEACLPRIREYKKKLFQTCDVDWDDVARFKQAFRCNVPKGWDQKRSAYIPNGHATSGYSRREGGNWMEEEFSQDAVPEVVFSSGKPRIVTMYSSYNSEILAPIHQALWKVISRKGWLLVGSPTDEKVRNLNGHGPLMSYDYEAATDNIKAAYCRAAVEVLKEQADWLSDEEVRCLDVVCNLRISGIPRVADRGQPMGSLMSFPLLCLINKTVVDLAMLDLLEKKKVGFKEWSSHRCLINGDDLLLRSPTVNSDDYDACHRRWGNSVGLVVNVEKTMVDQEKGEINSTLFERGTLKKKENLAALFMSGDTQDVLRVAMEAATSLKSFRRIVRLNAHILARQDEKFPSTLPMRYRLSLLGDRKIRKALRAAPRSERPVAFNPLTVCDRPFGYFLTKEEERKAISARVVDVRKYELFRKEKVKFTTTVVKDARRLSDVYRAAEVKPDEDKILSCCAKYWEDKRKAELRCLEPDMPTYPKFVSDLPCAFALVDQIRRWKNERKSWLLEETTPASASAGDPPETWMMSSLEDP